MKTIDRVIIVLGILLIVGALSKGPALCGEQQYQFFSAENKIYRGNTSTGHFDVWKWDLSDTGGNWQSVKTIKQSTYKVE